MPCGELTDYCAGWDIPEHKFPEYIRVTVKRDATNFIGGLRKVGPDIAWSKMRMLITESYGKSNRQKGVSDRLHSPRYADFETNGENTATTL